MKSIKNNKDVIRVAAEQSAAATGAAVARSRRTAVAPGRGLLLSRETGAAAAASRGEAAKRDRLAPAVNKSRSSSLWWRENCLLDDRSDKSL